MGLVEKHRETVVDLKMCWNMFLRGFLHEDVHGRRE